MSGATTEETVHRSPYQGLAPYSEADETFFFGRDREAHLVMNSLLAMRHTVLYGPSGAGKSSLLSAGVVPRLRDRARHNAERSGQPDLAVVICRQWQSGSGLAELTSAVQESVAQALGDGTLSAAAENLVGLLRAAGESLSGGVLIVLDQLEEYFVYHANRDEVSVELVRVLTAPGVRANYVLSIREDALAQLDRFKAAIPTLFDHTVRIDSLDREQARDAITRPVEQFNRLFAKSFDVEEKLVNSVVDELSAGGRPLDGAAPSGKVEAPLLQTVMSRVWQRELTLGSTLLRAGTFHELGGAEEIFRALVEEGLGTLSEGELRIAAEVFRFLVTSSGTKLALTEADLSSYTGRAGEELSPVLKKLSDARVRLLRPVVSEGADGATRFELFHDVLAEPILDWTSRHASESRVAVLERAVATAERRFRLALAGCGLLLAALAVVALR